MMLVENGKSVFFTYSVTYKMSEVGWAHRYDHYMKTGSDSINYLMLLVSFCVVITLAFVAVTLLRKVLGRDFDKISRWFNLR